MTIHRPKGPPGGVEAVTSALGHFVSAEPPLGGRALPDAGSVTIAEPLRVFVLGLDDLGGGYALEKAQPVAWRYMVGAKEPAAFVDVRERGGGAVFQKMVRGQPAAGLLRAAHAAAAHDEAPNGPDVEVRVLDVPALHRMALWLHGASENLFVPVVRNDERVRVLDGQAFLGELRGEAEKMVVVRPGNSAVAG